MTSKAEEPRVDDLVMIRLGAAQRLHVARLEKIEGMLHVVRKFLPHASGDDGLPGAWAKHVVKLPRTMVLPVAPDDPRLEAAKVALPPSEAPAPRPRSKISTKRAKKKALKKTTKKTPRRASAPATAHQEST